MGQVEKVIELAQHLAEETPGFFEVKGAGVGDRATNAFMVELRKRAAATLGEDFAERRICGENNLAVDFFFPEEAAVLEVAFSLRNPASEFERDLLKALMAKESGHEVRRLVFLSKPGALKRHKQPSTGAIVAWTRRKHGLDVEFHELRAGSDL
jgi:hypothetical protein